METLGLLLHPPLGLGSDAASKAKFGWGCIDNKNISRMLQFIPRRFMKERSLAFLPTLFMIVVTMSAMSMAQPQTFATRHTRDAVVNGEAQFVGKLPGTQLMKFDIVLPLRNDARLENFLKGSLRSNQSQLSAFPHA